MFAAWVMKAMSCNVVTLALFAANGRLTGTVWQAAGVALPALLVGTWFGFRVSRRVNPPHFRRIVLGLLVLSAGSALLTVAVG